MSKQLELPFEIEVPLQDGTKLVGVVDYHADDADLENPRQRGDAVCNLILHPNYQHWLGEQDETCQVPSKDNDNPVTHMERVIKKQLGLRKDQVVASPITMYKHSGITLSRGVAQGWDYSVIGFIVLRKSDVRKMKGWGVVTPERVPEVHKIMDKELEDLTHWLNGWGTYWRISHASPDDTPDDDSFDEDINFSGGWLNALADCIEDMKGHLRCANDAQGDNKCVNLPKSLL